MILGKDAKKALLQAMGLEVKGCQDVQLIIPVDGISTVHITYLLKPEWVAGMGKILGDQQDSKKELLIRGGPVDPSKTYIA